MSPIAVCDDRIVPSASVKNRAARIFHALTRPVALLKWCAALAMCGTTGCLHPKIGPQSLPIDRAAYSASLSDSWKEQALLNIVKIRYVDPPVFVDVGSIVASYTLTQNANAGGTIPTSGGGSANVAGSLGLSNSPTITYTPLTGNDYIKALRTPLPVSVVFAAIQNGIPADSILLSLIMSINGLRNQRVSLQGITPADPEFHRVRELMRDIQASGALRLAVKVDPNKQEADLLTLRTRDISPEVLAAIRELRGLLHLNPEATELRLVSAPFASSDTEVAVQTRSIVELLQNAAAQVEVPSEDIARHRAVPGFESGRDFPGVVPMIRVHSAKTKPGDAFVAVNYRHTWFFISDDDLFSKRAFAQLMELFTMAESGPKANQPVVTIPAR